MAQTAASRCAIPPKKGWPPRRRRPKIAGNAKDQNISPLSATYTPAPPAAAHPAVTLKQSRGRAIMPILPDQVSRFLLEFPSAPWKTSRPVFPVTPSLSCVLRRHAQASQAPQRRSPHDHLRLSPLRHSLRPFPHRRDRARSHAAKRFPRKSRQVPAAAEEQRANRASRKGPRTSQRRNPRRPECPENSWSKAPQGGLIFSATDSARVLCRYRNLQRRQTPLLRPQKANQTRRLI